VDDLVLWNSVFLHDLISMASIRLMSVVVELVRSSNDDGPVVRLWSSKGLVVVFSVVFTVVLGGGSGDSAKSEVLLEHFES